MKATFDEDGNLVIGKKRYSDFFSKKQNISKYQFGDGVLIQSNPNVAYYEPEYRDYIDDYRYEKPGYVRVKHYYKQQVFWDHVVVTIKGNVVIFESDDESHRSYKFCLAHGYVKSYSEFKRIQERDGIKDKWAEKNDVKLVRISSELSPKQKMQLINDSLINY